MITSVQFKVSTEFGECSFCGEECKIIRIAAIVNTDLWSKLVPSQEEWYMNYCLECLNERLGGNLLSKDPIETPYIR